jgi:hypothetical protein
LPEKRELIFFRSADSPNSGLVDAVDVVFFAVVVVLGVAQVPPLFEGEDV